MNDTRFDTRSSEWIGDMTVWLRENSADNSERLERLRRMGFRTAALALSDEAVSLEDPRLQAEEKLAVILGTEGDGLAAQTLACCDYTVQIPMSHGVDSLNVAAASAVAFWQLRARERAPAAPQTE